MKKIIAITAMAAMVAAAAMADEPDVDLKIAEISGNAKVTWGIDLDSNAVTGRTGFKNEEEAKLKVNIANGGSKFTEGEGVWGELEVKVGDALTATNGALGGGSASINTAKLHVGDLYIGIRSGDTQVGDYNVPNAVKSSTIGIGKKGESKTQGLVVGYGNDLFGIDVDFRSEPDGTDYYTDDYALAAEASLKDLSGLSAKAGASFAFKSKLLGVEGSVDYKLPLGDNFLKVGVGAGFEKASGASLSNGEVAAGVVFGWGDEAEEAAGFYYLGSKDNTKKRTPGVGVAVYLPLYTHTYLDIVPSFYSGEIVENLTAAVLGEVIIPIDNAGINMGMAVAGDVSYKLAVGDAISVTPKAGFRFANADYIGGKASAIFTTANTDNSGLSDLTPAGTSGLLNFKAGVEIGGLIPNTTFDAWYQSRNLTGSGNGKAGTFNISAKIAL